jgi:hypothetical protein
LPRFRRLRFDDVQQAGAQQALWPQASPQPTLTAATSFSTHRATMRVHMTVSVHGTVTHTVRVHWYGTWRVTQTLTVVVHCSGTHRVRQHGTVIVLHTGLQQVTVQVTGTCSHTRLQQVTTCCSQTMHGTQHFLHSIRGHGSQQLFFLQSRSRSRGLAGTMTVS